MATQAAAQPGRNDPVCVDPKHYTVELENEKVRVLRIKYGPHERSEMHGHPALVEVFLSHSHFRFTDPDGRTEEIVGSFLPSSISPKI